MAGLPYVLVELLLLLLIALPLEVVTAVSHDCLPIAGMLGVQLTRCGNTIKERSETLDGNPQILS